MVSEEQSLPSRYAYAALPEKNLIRILELLSGEAGDPIRCLVHHASLDESRNTYDALSYTWGDANNKTGILCDSGIVQVTHNLKDALRATRHPGKSRRIWADSVCINQSDTVEKSSQVEQMAEGYRNALQVTVWLGTDANGTAKRCFTLITDVNSYLDGLVEQYGHRRTLPRITLPPLLDDPSAWETVVGTASLSWFERVWVVQEVAISKETACYYGATSDWT